MTAITAHDFGSKLEPDRDRAPQRPASAACAPAPWPARLRRGALHLERYDRPPAGAHRALPRHSPMSSRA